MNAITKRETAALPVLQMDEAELMAVLRNSLYPGAKEESIKLVLGYCRAASLDPMQKPVHIVPMQVSTGRKDDNGWDIKETRDVVMPGIGLYRTQAARSGEYAGVTEPEFGEDVTEKLGDVAITYPKWCRITVKRFLNNAIVEFTAKEYWRENYATKSAKSAEPNAMWKRRPYAQLAKCCEAQALRKAFPEFGAQPTADEMEGAIEMEDGIGAQPSKPPVSMPQAKSSKPQDVTDVQPKATESTSRSAQTAEEPIARPLSSSARRVLKTKLEIAALSEQDMLARFGFGLEGVTTATYNAVVDWTKDPVDA